MNLTKEKGRYSMGEKFRCPHCLEMQEDVIEDYVIPGRIGVTSAGIDNCHSCNKIFMVVRGGDGFYSVTKTGR